jgi:hypothetical protein
MDANRQANDIEAGDVTEDRKQPSNRCQGIRAESKGGIVNRRKLLSLLGMAPVALAANPLSAAEAQEKTKKPASALSSDPSHGKITTVNPKGTPPPIQLIPMAPRLDSLDGKTVYLVDTGFHGGDMLLHQVEAWFGRNMPTTTIVFRRKAGPYAEDDPNLWKEIKAKGNAVIMAIGH